MLETLVRPKDADPYLPRVIAERRDGEMFLTPDVFAEMNQILGRRFEIQGTHPIAVVFQRGPGTVTIMADEKLFMPENNPFQRTSVEYRGPFRSELINFDRIQTNKDGGITFVKFDQDCYSLIAIQRNGFASLTSGPATELPIL